jgi:hypothetical protein
MAGKEMEGNEEHCRRKAGDARRHGDAPSRHGATRRASKQRLAAA